MITSRQIVKDRMNQSRLIVLIGLICVLLLQVDTVRCFSPVDTSQIRQTLATATVTSLRPMSSSPWLSSSSTLPNTRSPSSSASTFATCTRLNAVMDIVGVSPEPIHTAFAFATFGPQPFWLLMILLPKADITKKVMGKLDVVLFFALLHFFIVGSSIAQPDSTAPLLEFNDVFDPSKDSQAAFMNMVTNYPNFVAEEWPHVLTWDLFVGRMIWMDGLKRNIFTSHSVLFANLIGPPGLLLHWLTCTVTGNDINDDEDQ